MSTLIYQRPNIANTVITQTQPVSHLTSAIHVGLVLLLAAFLPLKFQPVFVFLCFVTFLILIVWLHFSLQAWGRRGLGRLWALLTTLEQQATTVSSQGSRAQCIVQLTLRIILIGLLGWCSPPRGCTVLLVGRVLVLQGVVVSNLAGSIDYTVSKYVAIMKTYLSVCFWCSWICSEQIIWFSWVNSLQTDLIYKGVN